MQGQQRMTFSLASEPWIPVAYLDGHSAELSILQTFQDASDIRCLQGDIPQQELPILRLLEAILYRTLPIPEGSESGLSEDATLGLWKQLWSKGRFDTEDIEDYLGYFRDRFDLMDANNPFFQVANLEYVGKGPDGVGELVADIPKPEKFLFSMRNKDQVTDLSLAEAARWLVFQQSYATAGIKTPVKGNSYAKHGKAYAPKGPGGTGLLGAEGGVYLEGSNLFQTLLLNMVLYDETRHTGPSIVGENAGVPSWELESPGPDMRPSVMGVPANPVQAYTWQSRRMRLVFDEDGTRVTGVVSCYGDIPAVINGDTADPMTRWRLSETQQKKLGLSLLPKMPMVHDPERAIWRGLSALVACEKGAADCRPGVIRWFELLSDEGVLPEDAIPSVAVHAQGMSYGTQSSVFEDGVDDVFRVSSEVLKHDTIASHNAVEVVTQTDSAVKELVKFVRNVQRACGDKSSKNIAQAKAARVSSEAFDALDQLCREKIASFPVTTDEGALDYCNAWRGLIHTKLLGLARDYVREEELSFFTEHFDSPDDMSKGRGMTVGRASMFLRVGLNKILGPLQATRDVQKGAAR